MEFLGIKPRVLRMSGKQSTDWATPLAPNMILEIAQQTNSQSGVLKCTHFTTIFLIERDSSYPRRYNDLNFWSWLYIASRNTQNLLDSVLINFSELPNSKTPYGRALVSSCLSDDALTQASPATIVLADHRSEPNKPDQKKYLNANLLTYRIMF